MKILIISGFLGAGKTTFIRAMSQKTKRDFVVYENECGATDADTKLLENEEISVWESTENCVCCTGKSGFSSSLLAIASGLDPEYLVVEPTGAARLGALLQNVSQMRYDKISVLPPVAIVDCVNFRQQMHAAPDIWRDQVANASTIFLSKTERSSMEERKALKELIRSLNSEAQLLEKPLNELDEKFFLSLLEDPRQAAVVSSQDIGTEKNPETFSLEGLSFPSPAHLFTFLDLSVGGAFGKLSRAKGYAPCGSNGEWLRFDLVAREWAVTGMEILRDAPSSVVFIGEELNRRILREALLFGGKRESSASPLRSLLGKK